MSNKYWAIAITVLVGFLASAGAGAQPAKPPADNLNVTMVLLPEKATGPETITRQIALPAQPDRGKSGDKPSPEQRPGDVGAGKDTAAEARERGRAFGQEVAEQARENRENAGRGDDKLPHDPPGRPPNEPPPAH